MTEKLLKELTNSGRLFLIPTTIHDKFIIRFTVTSQFTTKEDILRDWNIIQQTAAQIINQHYVLHPLNPADGVKSPNLLSNTNPHAVNITSEFSKDEGKYKIPSRKIIVQPKKVAVSPAKFVVSQQLEGQVDSLDDCFPEEVPDVSKHKLSSFLFSYLSVKDEKKTARSLSCNSVPTTSFRELSNPKAATSEKTSSHDKDKIFSKLPEEVMMLKKSAFKKLIKFYSVPSFPECSIQCGIHLPCCPLQAII